jgi:hypothetical protein
MKIAIQHHIVRGWVLSLYLLAVLSLGFAHQRINITLPNADRTDISSNMMGVEASVMSHMAMMPMMPCPLSGSGGSQNAHKGHCEACLITQASGLDYVPTPNLNHTVVITDVSYSEKTLSVVTRLFKRGTQSRAPPAFA